MDRFKYPERFEQFLRLIISASSIGKFPIFRIYPIKKVGSNAGNIPEPEDCAGAPAQFYFVAPSTDIAFVFPLTNAIYNHYCAAS